MVLTNQRDPLGDILPCADFMAAYVKNLLECTGGLTALMSDRLCPWCSHWSPFGGCDEFFDRLLLAIGIGAALFWLLLPSGMWEGWLCGYGMLVLSVTCFSLWRVMRELRLRTTFEQAARQLGAENATLKQSSEQLQSDLTMLQDTIGALGDKGDDWLGQLRGLYLSQKRENDRQSLLLRGHARIVLLQLIQHFDSDHTMRLNTQELAAAEAFLVAGFPEMDIKHLEDKAASGGVTIADLEPLLLEHLGAATGQSPPPRLLGGPGGGGADVVEVVIEQPPSTPPAKRSLMSRLSA